MPADEKPAVSVAAMTSDSGEDRSSSQSSGSAVKKRVTIFENKMMSDDPNNNNNSSNSKIVASSPAKVKIDLRSAGKTASSSEVGIVEGKLPSPTFKVCMIVSILRFFANGEGASIYDVEFSAIKKCSSPPSVCKIHSVQSA